MGFFAVLKKAAVGFLAATLALSSLTGCSLMTVEPESLMRPPRPTGEKADIHAVLEGSAGSGITLKYPASGEFRSAIVMHDLTADGQEEAIAFYQKKADSVGISVMFINKRDGQWSDIGAFDNPAAQVDKVSFGDVNGDGQDEVIVGWGSSQSSTGVCVYYCQDGVMKQMDLDQSYSQFAVMDFDNDGYSEIFTANVTVGDQVATGRLFRVRGDALEIMGTVPLDPGVTKYASVSAGLINESQRGIVLDGVKSATRMTTEIVYWDIAENTMKSPFYDPDKQTTYVERSTSVVSRDINGDTIIEVPVVTLLPGYDAKANTVADASSLTDWYRYDTKAGALVRVMSMVVNNTDGYWFLVPDMWQGHFTTQQSTKNRSLTFYEWLPAVEKGGTGTLGNELMTIRAFTQKEWTDAKNINQYEKIMDANGMVYAASVSSQENSLAISLANIKNSFKLISQDS